MNQLASRHFAHVLDRPVKGYDSAQHGVGRDNDAIGGYNGIGWYEHFEDHANGQVYRVHCSDGVYGGKSSHSNDDLAWLEDRYREIKARTNAESTTGVSEIKLSSGEWAIMLSFTHHDWVDLQPGQKYADADRSVKLGRIGTINGIPVIVTEDAKFPFNLPS